MVVSRVSALPSAFMTYSSPSTPSLVEMKAIFVPSGDHIGFRSLFTSAELRAVRPVPSALMTSIKPALAYAIYVPSGDQAG